MEKITDDMIINYINNELYKKNISLGWNYDIFKYNDIKINRQNNSIVVDLIYSENNKDMCKTFYFPLENFE